MFGKSKGNGANNRDSSSAQEVKRSGVTYSASPAAPEGTSFISSGLSIVGKIVGEGTLEIFGHVKGEVHASIVQIGDGAQVEGDIVAELTKIQLKLVFGRTWPDTFRDNNPSFLRDGVYGFNFFHGGHGYAAFPSGHTAVTCAVISVLWIYCPKWRWLYALAVLAVAVGLIGANYHFVSDVIAGGTHKLFLLL